MEKANQHNLTDFFELYNHIDDPVVVTNKASAILFANPQAILLFEILGKSNLTHLPVFKNQAGTVYCEIRSYLGFGKKVNIADEEVLLFHFKIKNTSEISESEKKYRSLFEQALEGIFIMDDTGKIIEANPAACRIYEVGKKDFEKLKIHHVFPHKSFDEAEQIWQEFLKSGEINGFYKFLSPAGNTKYIDFRAKVNFLPHLHLAVFNDVTQRVATEKALQTSEANLKAIFNSSNQQIILLDKDLRIVTANEKANISSIRNVNRPLTVGTLITEYGNEERNKTFLPVFQKVLQGETFKFEDSPFSTQPTEWIEIEFLPVFENETVKGICLAITDISLRKMAELSLSEREARFRSLVQNSSDIIIILSREGEINYVSSSAEKILQYKDGELDNEDFFRFIHPEDKEYIVDFLAKSLKGNKQGAVSEFRFLHSDGYYVSLETTWTNLLDNPHINGIILNSRDITFRKIQEQNLLLLERAINSSNSGIVITDPNQPDNPVVYANKAYENITGYSYHEIIGRNSRYLQRNDILQPELSRLRIAIQDKKETTVVIKNYKKDGTLFYNQLSISPVFNRDGELTNFLGVTNDITERKIAEDALIEITRGTSGTEGKNFYENLAKYLHLTLYLDSVVIAGIENDKVKAKVILKDGKIISNQEKYITLPSENDAVNSLLKEISVQFLQMSVLHDEESRLVSCVPLQNSEGKIIGNIFCISGNIHVNPDLVQTTLRIFALRVAAEMERDYHLLAVSASEEKFRGLAENSPDIIYIINLPQKRIIYFNRKNIFGYPTSSLVTSESWIDIVHPEDINMVTSHWKKFISSGKGNSSSIEYRVRTEQGDYEWVINRHAILDRDEQQNPVNVLLNMTIITGRKAAEEAVRENQASLSALIENTNDIIWSIDQQYFLTTFNSSFKNLLKNYKKKVSIGDNLLEVLPDELTDTWIAAHKKAMKGERFTMEINNISQKNLSYEISFNPIVSEKGEINGVSVFARDITQRKISENDIIRTNFELDSFVYRASHDLRAPLRSVLGLINLAKIEENEKQRNQYLKLVDKSVNKLDSFISDLTNFSRNSRLEVLVDVVNFNTILDECMENLKYMENAHRIRMEKHFNLSKSFHSDSNRISVIFHNLISNSIKYLNVMSDDCWVKVIINQADNGIEILVEDNGRGIKEEYLDKIFNMFFRASQDSYGSGLGLYITKQVVEKLEGNIKVHSAFGKGTTFTIHLPDLQTKQKD